MAKRIIFIILLIAVAVCFTGCQAIEGMGRDMQWTGESIQKTAN